MKYWAYVSLFLLLSVFAAQSFALDHFQSEHAAQKHCPSDTVVGLTSQPEYFILKGSAGMAEQRMELLCARRRPLRKVTEPQGMGNRALFNVGMWRKTATPCR